jgi:hypothetical protein
MNKWKKSIACSETSFLETKDLVVMISKNLNFVPLECPTCCLLMSDNRDSSSYLTFGCCNDCLMEVAQPNMERWKDGWRPSKEDRKLIKKKRLELPSYIMSE